MNSCISIKSLLAIVGWLGSVCVSFAAENAISEQWRFITGPVNGAVLQQGDNNLVFYGDPENKIEQADYVLFTHSRRDAVWAGQALVAKGSHGVGPATEASFFNNPSAYWNEFQTKRFHDYAQQSTKALTAPVKLDRTVKEGDTVEWKGNVIHVLNTPGFTKGAASYWLEVNGKRFAFTGDLIYGEGKIFDLYSLQDAISSAKIGGYHGYAGRMGDVIASLRKILALNPDIIIPLRGPLIEHPKAAIEKLISRLQAMYANYLSIDALRWYFKDEHIIAKANRVLGPERLVEWMPMAEVRTNLPTWITVISNSRLITSDDKSGFLIDCGGKNIIDQLDKLRSLNKLTKIEHVFITHYHDDHTDQAAQLVNQHGCTVHASQANWDILERPEAYRMPCLTANPIHVSGRGENGHHWRWKEFEFTLFYFPGQTLNHDALLVKKDGEEVFFIGDSFTPCGIDDYCLQNRNLLHPQSGFFYCLDLVEKSAPHAWLINQHVEPAFRFSAKQIAQMHNTLVHRVNLLRELFPWDDINYGLDEGWARFYPYAIITTANSTETVSLRIFNHSPTERLFKAQLNLPKEWEIVSQQPNPIRINSREEGAILFKIKIPSGVEPSLQIITADISSEGWDLRQWTECIIQAKR